MYYVYAIQSLKDSRIYIGLSDNYNRRIREHNAGYTKPTKPYRPWVLIYTEECGTRENARKREKYLKSGCGKEFLKQNFSRVAPTFASLRRGRQLTPLSAENR